MRLRLPYYLNQLGVANYKGSNTLQLSSDCLNEVRERAGGTAFRIESSDLTLALLQNERKIELAFEDHRFYDLKRWRIADQIWSGDSDTSTARMTGLWPYKVYAPDSRKMESGFSEGCILSIVVMIMRRDYLSDSDKICIMQNIR